MSRSRRSRWRRRWSSRIDKVKRLLDELVADYAQPEHGLSVREVAGGYKMATKAEHHEAVRAFVKKLTPPLKLSLAALETLAVVAYKQPVTAPEIMEIRGVQGAGVLKTLLDRKLIAESGRKNVVGKPILYKTTKDFLVQFGLKDLSELPTLKEFEELGRLEIWSEPEAGDRASKPCKQCRRPEPGSAGGAAIQRQPMTMPEERLQKILSQAGVASRRKAEELIVEGRVTVNGATVTELGSKADLERDHIKVDGRLLRKPKRHVYIALQQTEGLRDHGFRSGRPRNRDASAARREGARVPGGAPRLSQRRAAAADQRRRVRASHHRAREPRDEDLRGESQRRAHRRAGAAVSRRRFRCTAARLRRRS